MIKRIGSVLLASFLLVSLASGPSSAGSRTVRDKAGDNHRTLDIRKATFSNGRHAVGTKVRFQPARPQRACLTVVVDVGKRRGKAYNAITCIAKSGNYTHALFRLRKHGGPKRVKCRGMRAEWTIEGRLATRVKVPQRCVNGIGKARFKAVSKHPKRRGIDQTRSVRLHRS